MKLDELIGGSIYVDTNVLYMAIIQRLGLTTIASDDTDFDRIEGLERHWVINPPEQRRSRDVRRPR